MTKRIQKRNKLGQFRKASPWDNIAFMRTVKQISFKLLALMLVVGLNGAALSNIGYTLGYYNDEENSNENTFTGGMLDVVLSNTEFEGVISNDSGDQSQFETNISLTDGSLPTQYDVEYEKTGGDDTMCNALAFNATHGSLLYSGALPSFSISSTTDFGLWSFVISVSSSQSVTAGETCEFDLIYKAWIDGALTFETSGYNDEERFHIVINATEAESPVVINEFLPKPDGPLCSNPANEDCDSGDLDFIFDFGSDSSDMPQGEWVELYNLTGSPVDLSNWYTQDAPGGVGNTNITNLSSIPATLLIPAHGFLVIYMNKPVWNNTGDIVKLFNASDVLQDSYAYTSDYDYCYITPTPGVTNDETPLGGGIDCTPGVNIPKNKSYARIPNGTGPFVDPVPTPGVINSLNEANAPEILVDVVEEILELAPTPIETQPSQEVSTDTEVVTEEIGDNTTIETPEIESIPLAEEAIDEEIVIPEETIIEEATVEEESEPASESEPAPEPTPEPAPVEITP